MNFISVSKNEGIATITLQRGKVNAINEVVVAELDECLSDLEIDPEINSIILTGQGKFFSFGFDIPEFLSFSKDDFAQFLTQFTNLYTRVFLFPKPIIAALNGHTMAGGCMLASACDWKIMVSGKSKIALNEIGFGSSVLAGSVEMLGYCAGWKNAEKVLFSGSMYMAEEALTLGMIDQVSTEEELTSEAEAKARELGKKDATAFNSIKKLLREPVAERMVNREKASIQEVCAIWYSPKTRENLQQIKIK
ncbi:enoyl-CoA hydratase/isomerase family protein [Mangrovibacterium lignilyticum]|uniref:enoyl-CoA hydratase/isomerase family protein n=1 Tax=Mangrovibacterium lignilyticum TaxID=2668052 RepID=UPI0013D2DC02|nr:enoyl-CoA hydratase/isomerase family protein [Mangrovibacterium lignilyticum]